MIISQLQILTEKCQELGKNVVVRGTLADIERFIDDVSVYTASADEAVSYDYIKGSDNTLLYEFCLYL